MSKVRALCDSIPEGLVAAPGLLLDLDGTVRDSDGFLRETGKQWIMRGRIVLMRELKERGWRIIGITNHRAINAGHGDLDQDICDAIQQETQTLCDGLFDDIFWPDADDDAVKKPAPTMLELAGKLWNLDPKSTVMVGNSEDDNGAADAAGIPYSDQKSFFANPAITIELLDSLLGHSKQADEASFLPRTDSVVFGPDDSLAVQPLENRRYKLPDFPVGRPAPFAQAVRVLPPGGALEPGVHGYEHSFHVGEAAEVPQGYQFVPAQDVLKNLYGSQGLAVNRPYHELDRARIRTILRSLRARAKKRQAEPAAPVPQVPDAIQAPAPLQG